MNHQDLDTLLKTAAVAGTLLGLAGLLVALIALRKKRQSDTEFSLVVDANNDLDRTNAVLRAAASTRLQPQITDQTELAELRKHVSDLDAGLEAAMRDRDIWQNKYHDCLAEGAIVDEIDDTTAVITSAPPKM